MLKHVKAFISYIYEKSFRSSMFRLKRIERERILAAFPEPKDFLERSFFQYQCHMQSVSRLLRFCQSAVAYPVFLALLLGSFRSSAKKARTNRAVFISYGIGKEIIPQSLTDRFGEIIRVDDSPLLFTKRERRWFLPVWKRYWAHPYFLLKCYTKVGMYAAIEQTYQPEALIVYSEFSFTSSLLTAYCEAIGLEHINVLHGEKLLNIRDVFLGYHRFYVWSEEYRKLFLQMRAVPDQFVVEAPPMLQLKLPDHAEKEYDLTYYAGSLTQPQLALLRPCLDKLKDRGMRICIRLHPRFGDNQLIRQQLEGFSFEEANAVSLEHSLARTGACCGIASTVLQQAYLCGKDIVIDDVSDPEKFLLMEDLGYQMLQVPHRLLSDVGCTHVK